MRTSPMGLCALANSFQHGLIVLIVLKLQGLYNSFSLSCLIIVKIVQLIHSYKYDFGVRTNENNALGSLHASY